MQKYLNHNGIGDWIMDGHYDTGPILSPLAFLRSGLYNYDSGSLYGRTSYGYYWSSSPFYSILISHYLAFSSTYLYPQYEASRGYGFPLRCLAR